MNQDKKEKLSGKAVEKTIFGVSAGVFAVGAFVLGVVITPVPVVGWILGPTLIGTGLIMGAGAAGFTLAGLKDAAEWALRSAIDGFKSAFNGLKSLFSPKVVDTPSVGVGADMSKVPTKVVDTSKSVQGAPGVGQSHTLSDGTVNGLRVAKTKEFDPHNSL